MEPFFMEDFGCKRCGTSFRTEGDLRIHKYGYQIKEVVEFCYHGVSEEVSREPGGIRNGDFVCPFCGESSHSTANSLVKHVNDEHGETYSFEESKSLQRPESKYTTAVLSAFDAFYQTKKERNKTLLLAKLGDLEPVKFTDSEGTEHYLMAARDVIDNLTTSSSSFTSISKQ